MEYVIGWMTARPGMRDELLARSQDFVAATRRETGVLFFELLPASGDPAVVVAVEGYASTAAHQAHVGSAHFAAFWQIFQEFIVEGSFDNITADHVRTDRVKTG